MTHTHGIHYQHTKRPGWGAALYTGAVEGKLRFLFADGQVRSFAPDFAHLLERVEAPADEPEPAKVRAPKPVKLRRANHWLPDEDALALAGEAVEGRTAGATVARRRLLLGDAVPRHRSRAWTDAEEADLMASDDPIAVIAVRLDRTPKAIVSRRRILDLERRRKLWTPEDDALLLAGRPVPGRTPGSRRARRQELGQTSPTEWTSTEEAALLAGEDVAGRTPSACSQHKAMMRRRGRL